MDIKAVYLSICNQFIDWNVLMDRIHWKIFSCWLSRNYYSGYIFDSYFWHYVAVFTVTCYKHPRFPIFHSGSWLLSCRYSSVGRASDWRSEGPWFDPEWRQLFWLYLYAYDAFVWKKNFFNWIYVYALIIMPKNEIFWQKVFLI